MLIYGKEIREKIKNEIARAAEQQPMTLAVIVVGQEKASQSYVNSIVRFGEEAGVKVDKVELNANITEDSLIACINEYNHNELVDGIMLQTPLPEGINTERVIDAIAFTKDVEGLHNTNLGMLAAKKASVAPATPKAVMRILKEHDIILEGKKVCIIGRSTVVGLPLALMMIHASATVTVCHSKTARLADEIRSADIVVAAMGRINFVTADMIGSEQVIIDVGTNFDSSGKMFGDISPEAKEKAAVASAVPGGVGLITVAELFDNLRILKAQ